jgi:steroid delta-isomerase-like uncharacterized protein
VAETDTKSGTTKRSAAGKKPAKPRRSTKSRAVEKTARDYFEALDRHDLDAATEIWAPEVIEDIVPLGVFRGPAETRAFFEGLYAAMPDFQIKIERIVTDDGRAAVEYRMGGTFDGAPFQGIDSTGKTIDLRGFDLLEIEDGRIQTNTVYYDGAAFARAIGLLPPGDSGAERAMTSAFNLVTKARRAVAERKSG